MRLRNIAFSFIVFFISFVATAQKTVQELYLIFPYYIDVNELNHTLFEDITKQVLQQKALSHSFFWHSLKVSIGSLKSRVRLNALRLRFNDLVNTDLFNGDKNFASLAEVILYKAHAPNKIVALTQEQLLHYFTTGIEKYGYEKNAQDIGNSLSEHLNSWSEETFASECKRRRSCKGVHVVLPYEDANDLVNR
jgi:hypothetical protein